MDLSFGIGFCTSVKLVCDSVLITEPDGTRLFERIENPPWQQDDESFIQW